jgi:hypothetical protein
MSKKPTTFVTAVEVTPEVTIKDTGVAPPVVQQDKQYLTARFDKDFLSNAAPEADTKVEPEKTERRLTSRTRAEMEAGRKSIADYQ